MLRGCETLVNDFQGFVYHDQIKIWKNINMIVSFSFFAKNLNKIM